MTQAETEKTLAVVTEKLIALGEVSRPYRLTPHSHQGYNSQVYILTSGSKEFVVHLTKPFEHYFSDKTWGKLIAISEFLRQETKLPISRIIFAEPIQDFIVSAQEKLPGDIAGNVSLVDHQVIYNWLQSKNILMPQIQRTLAEIHSKPVSGYGLPVENGGVFAGAQATWNEFLLQRVSLWLGALEPGKNKRTLEIDLYQKIKTYADQFGEIPFVSGGSLVHGDLGNPSNILAENGRVTGIIDWEFALIGDPAWEFCDEGWIETIRATSLHDYFDASSVVAEEKRTEFLRRITLYRPLQCLMWLYVHRHDTDPIIFDTCVELLKKDLAEAKQRR